MRRPLIFAVTLVALAFGFVNLTAAGGGCRAPAGTTEGRGTQVRIANCGFGPTILHAPLGATITWTNADFLPHAINGLGWDASAPFEPANPGTSVSHRFDQAGIYPYMCYVHPGMAGLVVVGDVALNPNADSTTPIQTANITAAPLVSRAGPTAPSVGLPVALALAALAGAAGYTFSLMRRRWARIRVTITR